MNNKKSDYQVRRSTKVFFLNLFDRNIKEISMFSAWIMVTILFTSIEHKFFSQANFLGMLQSSSYIGIVAIGQCLVMISGGIDLSIGSTVGLSGIMSAYLMRMGFGVPIIIIGGIAVGIFFGLLNGLIITKFKIYDFMVTLGTMFIGHGIIMGITKGSSIYENMNESFLKLVSWKYGELTSRVLLFFIFLVIIQIVLVKTTYGRYLYAMGGNKTAAKLMGISIDRVKIIAYLLSGILASIVGILIVGDLKSGTPSAGDSFLFDTILAVVLGGATLTGGEGTMYGTFIGAFFLVSLFNGLTISGFSFYYQEIFKGAIFIIAITINSFIAIRRKKIII